MANAQINVEFIENSKGGQSLVYNNFRFQIKSRRDERVYWRCAVRTCPATIRTLNKIPIGFNLQHNHASDPHKLQVSKVMNAIKKRCREEADPVPTIYDEEIAKLRTPEWDDNTEQMVEKLPTFQSARSILYRQRSKLLPNLPATTNELDLQDQWVQTSTGEQFLLADDNNGPRILIFATHRNLQHLTNNTTIYGDGTFYTCPTLFTQLYSIHGTVNGQMYLLVYGLLPGKSEQIYTRFFNLIKAKCIDIGLQLQPATVMVDFETATINAAKTVFPGATLRGCFFHFTQCIWRKTQQTGLQIAYKEIEAVTLLVRRAAALPLVPEDKVEDVWFDALTEFENADVNTNTMPFTDYVTTQWVESDRHLWNHFDHEGPRTTNHLEGWHSKIKKRIQKAHPNIFTFINHIKQIQAVNEVNIIQVAAGGLPSHKRRKYRNMDSRLHQLKQRLRNNEITVMQYTDSASQLIHLG